MAVEPIEVRMARLEGGYQQIDRRLSEMQADIRELRGHLDDGISGLRRDAVQGWPFPAQLLGCHTQTIDLG